MLLKNWQFLTPFPFIDMRLSLQMQEFRHIIVCFFFQPSSKLSNLCNIGQVFFGFKCQLYNILTNKHATKHTSNPLSVLTFQLHSAWWVYCPNGAQARARVQEAGCQFAQFLPSFTTCTMSIQFFPTLPL